MTREEATVELARYFLQSFEEDPLAAVDFLDMNSDEIDALHRHAMAMIPEG
jgi:hypothetical protein